MTNPNTLSLTPPNNAFATMTVFNRAYSAAFGAVVTGIPYGDALTLMANGWTVASASSSSSSTTPVVTTTPLVVLNKLLVCANRGSIPNTVRNVTAANTMSVESRKSMTIGGAAVSELYLSYANFYILTNSGTEQIAAANGNPAVCAVNLFVAIEINGVTKQVSWSKALQMTQGPIASTISAAAGTGQSGAAGTNCRSQTGGIVLQPGASDIVCDPIYPWQFGLTSFAAGMTFFVREYRAVSSTVAFAAGLYSMADHTASSETGEGCYYADPTLIATSQLLSTGALVAPPSGNPAFTSCSFGPAAIVGRAIGTPDIAVLIIGDSLLDGTGDCYVSNFGDTAIANPAGNFAWAVNTAYAAGTQFNLGGKYYLCTVGGTSCPSGAAWAASTADALNAYAIGSSAGVTNLYKCTTAGTSGSTVPAWPASGTVTDGTTVWTWVSIYGPQGTGAAIIDNTVTWSYVATAGNFTSTPAGKGLNNAGFAMRALYNLAGRNVPVTKMTIGGSGVGQVYNAHILRRLYFKYHTHAISDYGSNDGAAVSEYGIYEPAATVYGWLQVLFASMKSADSNIRHILHMSCINRCATVDQGQTSGANQTPVTVSGTKYFGINGLFQYPLNTLLQAGVAAQTIQCDEYLDTTPLTSDATYTDHWPAKVSLDTVHPWGNTIQSALASVLAARIALWT